MTIKSATNTALQQLLSFKEGLSSTEMSGWMKTDKDKVNACHFWLKSYYNGWYCYKCYMKMKKNG